MPPASNIAASDRSSARRRQYVIAPENDDAAMWLDTVATETPGDTPRKISSGVIRKPPPMPNMPEMKPTARTWDCPHRRARGDRSSPTSSRCGRKAVLAAGSARLSYVFGCEPAFTLPAFERSDRRGGTARRRARTRLGLGGLGLIPAARGRPHDRRLRGRPVRNPGVDRMTQRRERALVERGRDLLALLCSLDVTALGSEREPLERLPEIALDADAARIEQ